MNPLIRCARSRGLGESEDARNERIEPECSRKLR